MYDRIFCDECTNIAREIEEAYAATWASSDSRFKEAWDATYRMIGGTEEDAERAEILAAGLDNPAAPRIQRAIFRKFEHEARTSHKVPWPA